MSSGALYRRSCPRTRSPVAVVALAGRAAGLASAGVAEATRVQDGKGGQTAKDAAPGRRAAAGAFRAFRLRRLSACL